MDVLTFERNTCRTKEQLLEVADGLRVRLRPDRLALRAVIQEHGRVVRPPGPAYSLFMLLGNDKLPFIPGMGHVNFFMWCVLSCVAVLVCGACLGRRLARRGACCSPAGTSGCAWRTAGGNLVPGAGAAVLTAAAAAASPAPRPQPVSV